MTDRQHALTVLADLREEVLVRYLTGSRLGPGPALAGLGATRSPASLGGASVPGNPGAPLATPPTIRIYAYRRGHPSRRGAERSGKFARLLFVAVVAPIVFVLLLAKGLALWISGWRRLGRV